MRELALTVAGYESRGVCRQFGYKEDQLADEVWLDQDYTGAWRSTTAASPA